MGISETEKRNIRDKKPKILENTKEILAEQQLHNCITINADWRMTVVLLKVQMFQRKYCRQF